MYTNAVGGMEHKHLPVEQNIRTQVFISCNIDPSGGSHISEAWS